MPVSVQHYHRNPVFVTDLKHQDVLLGQGTGASEHHGNRIFRDKIRKMKEHYVFAESRPHVVTDKMLNEIIEAVTKRGGRFVKKVPKKLLYEVLDYSSVLKKTRWTFDYYCRRQSYILGQSKTDPVMRAGRDSTASSMEEIVSKTRSSFVRGAPLLLHPSLPVPLSTSSSSTTRPLRSSLPEMGGGSSSGSAPAEKAHMIPSHHSETGNALFLGLASLGSESPRAGSTTSVESAPAFADRLGKAVRAQQIWPEKLPLKARCRFNAGLSLPFSSSSSSSRHYHQESRETQKGRRTVAENTKNKHRGVPHAPNSAKVIPSHEIGRNYAALSPEVKTNRVLRIEDTSYTSQFDPRLPARGAGSEQSRPSNYNILQQEDQAAKIRLLWERQHKQYLPPNSSVVASMSIEQVLQDLHDVQTLRMAAESSSSADHAPSLYFQQHAPAVLGRANGGGDSSLLYASLLLSSRLTNSQQQRTRRMSAVQQSVFIPSSLDSLAATTRRAPHDTKVQLTSPMLQRRSLASSLAPGADWQRRLLASRAAQPPSSHHNKKGV